MLFDPGGEIGIFLLSVYEGTALDCFPVSAIKGTDNPINGGEICLKKSLREESNGRFSFIPGR